MIGDGMGYGHIASNNLYESGQSKYLVEGLSLLELASFYSYLSLKFPKTLNIESSLMRNFSRALRVSVAAVATTALTTGLVAPAHAAASGPKNVIYM
ncbi:hypothetical protein HT105_22560, partial [Bacteroides fragilis]|nr:hypothetical protein [Bacteroides fragilis]